MPARPLALVTGASSGIGVDYADELALRGYDLILTARRLEKLEQVRADLIERHDVRVEVIRSDLAEQDGAERLHREVAEFRPVTVLINNAGMGLFGGFLDEPLEEIQRVIQVNTTSLTTLTRLFAEDMRRAGGGRILNMSSFSAVQRVPAYTVYSASKAYVLALSETLDRSLRPMGIHVTAVTAGYFDSPMLEHVGHRESRLLQLVTLNRRAVARAGIRGLLRGKSVVNPGVFYKFTDLLLRFLPRAAGPRLADRLVPSPDRQTRQRGIGG